MNKLLIALVMLLAFALPVTGNAADLALHDAPARLFFSPSGGATQAIEGQ